MTNPVKLIYHCSTGRLSGWAAALHLGGLSSDLSTLHPVFNRARMGRQPGEFVLVGTDGAGHEVYVWEHGRSLRIFAKAFASMNEIFGLRPATMFVDLNLPGFRRLGMIAMLNAFTAYDDTEILRWVRPELEAVVQSTIQSLRERP